MKFTGLKISGLFYREAWAHAYDRLYFSITQDIPERLTGAFEVLRDRENLNALRYGQENLASTVPDRYKDDLLHYIATGRFADLGLPAARRKAFLEIAKGKPLAEVIHDLEMVMLAAQEMYKLNERRGIDNLTGIANEIGYKKQLFQTLRNLPEKYIVIFCDLDGFGKLNKACGHIAGNGALREFTQKVKSVLRGNEIFYRKGGDEFVLILEEHEGKEIQLENVQKRIRDSVEGHIYAIGRDDGDIYPVAVSMGVEILETLTVNSRDIPEKIEELVDVADRGMVKDKGTKIRRLAAAKRMILGEIKSDSPDLKRFQADVGGQGSSPSGRNYE